MPHVCYLVHRLPPEEHTGTPLVALGYAEALTARGWTVTVVSGADPTETSWAAPQRLQGPSERFVHFRVPTAPLHDARWAIHAASVRSVETPAAAGFARILGLRRPDVVHVVDNVNLPLELPEVAKTAGIPVIRTVSCAEDLCGLVAPVSPCSGPSGYCVAPLTPAHCAACVAAARPDLLVDDPREGTVTDDDEEARASARARVERALERKRARTVHQYTNVFDRIVFSNAAWRRYFEATLPLDHSRARTIPMGMDVTRWSAADRRARSLVASEPVVFGVAGTLDVVKGADALVAALASPVLAGRDDFRVRCLGGGEPDRLARLAATGPHVELHGGYRPEELPGLLADVHVGIAPSYFETFHRVTREYLLAGLPVVASRAFGVLDVVRDGENGLLFDHAEPGELAQAMSRLLDDRDLLARLGEGASATPIRTVDEEADDLVALYEELAATVVEPVGAS